jgi:hypothetical protein
MRRSGLESECLGHASFNESITYGKEFDIRSDALRRIGLSDLV